MPTVKIAKKVTTEIQKPLPRPRKPVDAAGVRDIITQTNPLWQVLLKRLQKVGRVYGFQRIETPIIEELALYQSYYKDSDNAPTAVNFEAGGKTMALRPTILPSVLRSYVQHKVAEDRALSKWLYCGNVMTQGRDGKIVSDYEFGFEVLGEFTCLAEAQAISAAWYLTQSLGLNEASLEINTLGDGNSQNAYQDSLAGFLREKKFELCDNCNEAIGTRPLNALRCSNMECQIVLAEAPTILDFLDEESQKQFTDILEALDELQIPYQLNPLYVGPAGSCFTNVAIKHKRGNKTTVIGEGSYHDLVLKQLTGKGFSCFGFSGSLATLEQAMAASEIEVQSEIASEVFLVPLGELASKKSLRLFHDLTTADIRVYDHFGTVGVKNQLKAAEENKSPIALIMGQKEALDEMVILRDVKSGMQEVFSYDKIVIEVKKRLGK
jgi:histidyl-tRNA synthetase